MNNASFQVCPRCSVRVPRTVRRCAQCGARFHIEEPAPTATAPAAETPPPRRGPTRVAPIVSTSNSLDRISGINELEREILRAAMDGRRKGEGIYILGDAGRTEGEIKAGGQRIYGNEAVEAVADLVARGLIEQSGEELFELSDFGARMAPALTWQSKVVTESPGRGVAKDSCRGRTQLA